MTRYVALATDANPHYAFYAPIVTRLWRKFGWEPILFLHNGFWHTPFGGYVRDHLGTAHLIEIPRIEPLSVGNTMRVARLAAASSSLMDINDVVMTSDIDMAPLSSTFFDLAPLGSFVKLLRADMYGGMLGASSLARGSLEQASAQRRLIPGLFRFPMCYTAGDAMFWRTVFPLTIGDAEQSIRNIVVGLRHDQTDFDEACMSARLLASQYAQGRLIEGNDGAWWQGCLQMHMNTSWPSGRPNKMLLNDEHVVDDPVDFHMPRPFVPDVLEVLVKHFPDEEAFLRTYSQTALGLL